MPTYLRWCEKMWVLSACLASSMWHGQCYLERKYLILYYYQDDNCNRIIHGRVFVQDPTLFTGLFTTQSQKSEYPPPPLCWSSGGSSWCGSEWKMSRVMVPLDSWLWSACLPNHYPFYSLIAPHRTPCQPHGRGCDHGNVHLTPTTCHHPSPAYSYPPLPPPKSYLLINNPFIAGILYLGGLVVAIS